MRRHRLIVILVAFAATVGSAASPVRAQTATTSLQLRDPAATVWWEGDFSEAGVIVSAPETCALVGCDEVTIDVDVPAQPLRPDGGLQVAIAWDDEEQDLDLFVYGPDGQLAAKSDGFYTSMAESVLVPQPAEGVYRVVVVPRDTGELHYRGLAQIEAGTRPLPTRDLLPDLVALPVAHATFDTGTYYFSEPATSIGGCYPEERVERGANRCLRFDQTLGNAGTGPFEIRYDVTGVASRQSLRQRVHRSDGTIWERDAGTYELHPVHAHFHYRNFAVSRLWQADERGRPVGDEPLRAGHKNGFCVEDIVNMWFGRHGDAARSYYYPQCLLPESDGGAAALRQGMSVGWADTYNWFLADQYIEVTGVPDGSYVLETIADPDGLVLEADETNNTSLTPIRICGDRADVGATHSCPAVGSAMTTGSQP